MHKNRTALNTTLSNVMTKAVMKASSKLLRDFGEVEQLQVSKKGTGSFVSSADLRVEETLIKELRLARPDYGIISEESEALPPEEGCQYTWIIDPLDGTNNFLHGIPHFAVAIALQKDGETIAACIYDPTKDEMFCAEKGAGAFVNDKRLRVSARSHFSEALISTGPSFIQKNSQLNFSETLTHNLIGFRRMGATSLDLAYVAAGRLDAFVEVNPLIWDTAAGALMVREAGGYVSEINGKERKNESGSILATNTKLHANLIKLFA